MPQTEGLYVIVNVLFDIYLLFEQLVTKHACFCLAFSPLSYLAYTNAAGEEENKRTGVQESEVEAGRSDHKCLSISFRNIFP